MKATEPAVSPKNEVYLRQARHPLIDPRKVVANDISLGTDYQAMVITGPNTGGKTITLKTLGLLQLMAQSGLFIPVEAGSRVGVYNEIFADIGDEQSIEQNLSTFSSHMENIESFLAQIDAHSLVLVDELGAGTDPQEGAALAIAILDAIGAKEPKSLRRLTTQNLRRMGLTDLIRSMLVWSLTKKHSSRRTGYWSGFLVEVMRSISHSGWASRKRLLIKLGR